MGYVMDWDLIDECIDITPKCFLFYDDYAAELDLGERLKDMTVNCHVYRRLAGRLFISVAF